MNFKELNIEFSKQFGNQNPIQIQAPGRINILGEHIDYSGGTVLPAAVSQSIRFLISKRDDKEIVLWSIDYNEIWDGQLNHYHKSDLAWVNYFIGVLHELKGKITSGFNLAFSGDIPQGGGMSSSAALESGFVMSLNELFNLNLDKLEMAKICQKAEQNFAGVNCGIMDMYASIFGEKDKIIVLNCEDLESHLINLKSDEYSFILVNSEVKHSLADSAYNQRRATCQKAYNLLIKKYPDLSCLSKASKSQIEEIKNSFEPEDFEKIEYVVEENNRVKEAIKAINENNFIELGKLMTKTHWGLSKKYKVSCDELDYIVTEATNFDGLLGARLMGGGFGGCVLALLKNSEINSFSNYIQLSYQNKYGIVPEIYKVKPENGVSIV